MSYVPHTDGERADMLAAIGVARMEDLFADVGEKFRFPQLDLPPPAAEPELAREMRALAARNAAVDPSRSFLGAGVYHHFRPSTVDYVLSRGEFATSYTQYQPEVSQGMLQALFEYQSMICRLTGMEVSNASHYNGATALAEAVLLALNVGAGKRRKIVMSGAVHPQYRAVVQTYLRTHAATIVGDDDPAADLARLKPLLDRDTAALVIQNPNFFGACEPVDGLAEAAHAAGALLIVVTDPIALGLFQPPGAYGADVVVAEGQSLGLPPSFGGPHLGIFATRMAHVRRLSGHLVGETVDVDGRRGYVLTLATREQHIRRAKATSNICTNSALCAVGAAVYLATLGKRGLARVAELCFHNSHYAAAEIGKLKGFALARPSTTKPFFKEFVVRLPGPVAEINTRLRELHGIIGGYDLGRDFPHLQNHMLVAVTETHTRASIDAFVAALDEAAR
ncbi:MAG TPA: aminomethyl-transferring glycine dehydrogenase subunit GcvPA [Xanthobacteraceae bacterium]|nr:aminomethyl-transferring glycine dehydrogenase subunit GcvPA [Xanthobacteraceae bacterium]